MAEFKPDRILANIVIKGKVPGPAKDGSAAAIDGIPTLFVGGEFEEVDVKVRKAWWPEKMASFTVDKAAVPDALLTGMCDRSFGHVNWFPEMSRFVALYLHKAINARLAGGTDGKLTRVPFTSGWLTDPVGTTPPGPVATYTGDKKAAFWQFDAEMVRAWDPMYHRDLGKKEQMLAFTQNGVIAPWWNGWGVQQIEYQPLADGLSFRVQAAFRDEIPKPCSDAGIKLGHAYQDAIQYMVLGLAGATEQTGPDTFRIRFDREGFNGRTTHILIGTMHPGDSEYRATMAAARFDVPPNKGAKQTLTFPKINDVKPGVKSIPLNGAADSGLKPDYYVSWGPAVIDGDNLRFTTIPPSAKFPIQVKVTAYQWGKATEPKIATALPITQTFYIQNSTDANTK